MVHHSSCVDPKNYSEELGKQYAMEEVVDDLWAHLGFVLQWAKYGINVKPKESKYPPHIQRVITEYEELNDKIGKLNKFINSNPFFKKLDAEERNDMSCQLTSMRNYSDILLLVLQELALISNNLFKTKSMLKLNKCIIHRNLWR